MGGLLFFSIAGRGLHLFVYSLSSEAAGLSGLSLKAGTAMLSDAAPRAKVTNCSTVPINTTAAKRSKPFGDLGDEIK